MNEGHPNIFEAYSRFLDSTGVHLTYATLSTYLNFRDQLTKREIAFLKNHLDSCAACSSKLKEVAEVEGESLSRGVGKITRLAPATFRYAIAASIVVAVGLLSLVYLRNNGGEPAERSSLSREKTLAVQSSSPENFVPNEVLENFIGRKMRSASRASILAPHAGDTLAAPIRVTWSGKKSGSAYSILLVDNRNDEVWRGSTAEREIEVQSQLKPGLYYVKLEENKRLVSVSKFVIVR